MDLKYVIADQIKARLRALDWSEAELARRARIGQRTVNSLCNPDRSGSPRLNTLEAVAGPLGCTVAELIEPLSLEETEVLASYRRASDGRKESVRALLKAPEGLDSPPSPNPDQERYERHIEAQQARWRRRDRLALRDRGNQKQRDLLDPQD